ILDANNNLVTTDNSDAVTLTLATNPSGATLNGTNPVTVSAGVATFSNLSVSLAGTGFRLGATSGTLTGATSASFNVTASTVIEDFEQGLGQYVVLGGSYVFAGTGSYAAHDGNGGLDMAYSPGWLVRTDAGAQVHQGETISAWVQFASFVDGRAYVGFGASGGGTLSVVLAPNTGQFIIQDNSGYNFFNIAAVSQSYVPNHWYRVEVTW